MQKSNSLLSHETLGVYIIKTKIKNNKTSAFPTAGDAFVDIQYEILDYLPDLTSSVNTSTGVRPPCDCLYSILAQNNSSIECHKHKHKMAPLTSLVTWHLGTVEPTKGRHDFHEKDVQKWKKMCVCVKEAAYASKCVNASYCLYHLVNPSHTHTHRHTHTKKIEMINNKCKKKK